MSNANDIRTLARSKSSDDISSPGDDWLRVILNEDEVDPRIDTWNCKYSHVPQHTTQNSELAFNTTPFIFKSVNPAVNGVESNSSQKKKTRTIFTSNVNKLSLVEKVVEALGVVLEEVKSDI